MTFERRVAVGYLAALLSGDTAPGLNGARVTAVAFQQAPREAVDDLLVIARRDGDGSPSQHVAVGVRRAPRFTRSDPDTQKLLADYLQAQSIAAQTGDDREYILVVAGPQRAAGEIATLAGVARTATEPEFYELVEQPGRFTRAVRTRLEHFRSLVAGALDSLHGDSADEAVRSAAWRLLARLTVLQPRYEVPDVSDYEQLLNTLRHSARERTSEGAAALRDRLEALAGVYAPQAATIDRAMLRRDVHGLVTSDPSRTDPSWLTLQGLERTARNRVRATIGQTPRDGGLHLEREGLLASLRAKIRDNPVVLVHGVSGSGKSALVLAAVDAEKAGDGGEFDAVYVNLRDTPSSGLGLDTALRTPLADLLGLLTAPRRVLVIDGADYLTEVATTAFAGMVRSARDADVRLVIVATDDAVGAVRAELGPAVDVTPFVVPGLDDADLDRVAASNSRLRGLFSTARSKDLLRRPVIADLLARTQATSEAVTEVDAMQQIWAALIRRDGRPEQGAPTARDLTLRLLAEHALGRMVDDELLRRLDPVVVDALRRDGILSPPSEAPWRRIPEFFHEQLRLYAVCQVLLAQANPVEVLIATSAPRWTLPAARLAAQYLLGATNSGENAVAGRFQRLQASFDRLSASGYGDRWSDLPTEALLPLPSSEQLLSPAWAHLTEGGAAGLKRIFRLVQQRHVANALVEVPVAEPIVSALLENGWPREVNDAVALLTRNWLQALIAGDAASGHPLRVRLRDRIALRVSEADADAAETARAAAEAMAQRTPEQVAEEEDRRSRLPVMSGPIGFGRRRPETQREFQPRELTDEVIVEQLGLLGPDLGEPGEALLRRIAEHAPEDLEPAVETPLAGRAIASYRPSLLVELAEAYYIKEVHPEDDDFGWYDYDEGVRDHGHRLGLTPFSSPYRGPFLAMLQTDFRGGVAFLARLLNHATECRVKRSRRRGNHGDPVDYNSVELATTGVPRRYLGDMNVWLWYRGGGVGPYPCMSALQALEVVTDQLIAAGVSMDRLIPLLLADCESLPMVGFVVGMLVRHLENVGRLLDPYLSEPALWQLEFARIVQEGTGMLGSSNAVGSPERRKWSLREVATVLTVGADPSRASELSAVAALLEQHAREQVGLSADAELDGSADEHLAAVAGWASHLRRDSLTAIKTDEGLLIEATVPDAIAATLEPGQTENQMVAEAYRLINRYDHGRHSLVGPPPVDLGDLRADVEVARRLMAMESLRSETGLQACAAVACSVLERRYIMKDAVEPDDLSWAAELLLEIAALCAAQPDHDALYFAYFAHTPDMAVSRAVALLLLPDAAGLVSALRPGADTAYEPVVTANRWAATGASLDDRMAWSQSLDHLWGRAPVVLPGGKTSHEFLLDLIETSVRGCVVGEWDAERQRRRPAALEGSVVEALAAVDPSDVVAERLLPGIRALQELAVQSGSFAIRARALLDGLLDLYTTVRQQEEHGPQHSATDMLTVARVLLVLYESGHTRPVFRELEAVVDRNDLLDEFMDALSAVAEENPSRGRTAAALWPRLMKHALNLMDIGHVPVGDGFLAARGIASLIPNPSYSGNYLVREMRGTPVAWIDFDAIAPHVPRWLPFAAGHRESVDQMVALLRQTDVDQQVELGLPWVEELVRTAPESVAGRSHLLPEWLTSIGPASRARPQRAHWQRIVDRLLVAGEERVADLAD